MDVSQRLVVSANYHFRLLLILLMESMMASIRRRGLVPARVHPSWFRRRIGVKRLDTTTTTLLIVMSTVWTILICISIGAVHLMYGRRVIVYQVRPLLLLLMDLASDFRGHRRPRGHPQMVRPRGREVRLLLHDGGQAQGVHPLDHGVLGLGRKVIRPHVLMLGLEGELPVDAVLLGHGADLV